MKPSTLASVVSHLNVSGLLGRRRQAPADPVMSPDQITVAATSMRCGTSHSAAILVAGLPPEVAPGWLETLSATTGVVSTSIHITPVATEKATRSLHRKRSRLEASRLHALRHGRLDDPNIDAAAGDAADLASRIASGDTRLFTLAIYALLAAPTRQALAEQVADVRARAAATGLAVRVASFRQLQGLTSVLPFGLDLVRSGRTVDTDTIATLFPFTTPDPPANAGILLGHNLASGAPVTWDRFTQANHNQVVVARSGAGKSFLTKTEIARWAMRGVGVTVIDPDGEYTNLAEHLDGTVIRVGADDVRINPLEIPDTGESDALTRRVMFAHTVAATTLGIDLTPDEAAALDTALLAAYATAGITPDAGTWNRPAPLMTDVHTHLSTSDNPAARGLANRLAPFITGGFNRLFNGPATTIPTGHLVVFDLAELPDELAPLATVLVLDAAWRRATATSGRHLVFVDEAWRLLSTTAGAGFLARLAKSARKHSAGLSVITQDAEDMLSSDLGRIVIANAATQVLMSQAPATMRRVADAFDLTAAEQGFLATARQGEALLLAGDTHVAFASTSADMDPALLVTGEGAAS